MAKRLTEEMVIARTKISDLSKIKRLNCWGTELVDVSLLRRMPCVEVLSLSINKINSLEDFSQCHRLEELYIRQNDIRDLNQVCYLQNLANLKNLWLGENPCAATEGYRLAVIRALPQLQKLDNITVTPEEVKEAQRKGKVLSHPDDPQESEEEVYAPTQQYSSNRYQEYPAETEYSPQRSPTRQEPEYETEEVEEYYTREEPVEEQTEYSPPAQQSPPRRQEPVRRSYSPEPQYVERRRNSYDHESPKSHPQYYDKSSPTNNSNEDALSETIREVRIVSSQSTNSIKEFTNGDRYIQQSQYQRQAENVEGSGHNYENSRNRYTCAASHRPPFNRRPVTRNSNILSAVLCLVKELDYPSLEVVEMAVRCRMDELDE